MNKSILFGMSLALIFLTQSPAAYASFRLLSCSDGQVAFEIDNNGFGALDLHLTRDGGGIADFVVHAAGSDYHSPPDTHETVYQVDVTRKPNGDYSLVLADGFDGAYEFTPAQCQ